MKNDKMRITTQLILRCFKLSTLSSALGLFVGSALAQDILPFPDPPMGGSVGPTIQESVHQWREVPSHLPDDAPTF